MHILVREILMPAKGFAYFILTAKEEGGQTCNPAGGPFSRHFGTSFNTLIIVINGVQNQNNINI